MPEINLNDEDGFVTVTFKGKDGGEVTQSVDLYEVNNRLISLAGNVRDKPLEEYHAAIVDLLKSLGFPAVSHLVADRFATSIFKTVADLKNASGGEPNQGSPASTEPAFSDCEARTS